MWVHCNFEICLPSFLPVCICWHAEEALEFCQHCFKLTQQLVCWKCTAIATVVHYDQVGPLQQTARHVCVLHFVSSEYKGIWPALLFFRRHPRGICQGGGVLGCPLSPPRGCRLLKVPCCHGRVVNGSLYHTSILCLVQYPCPSHHRQ